MASRGALERRLATLAGFDEPRVALEQYETPADVAAHLIHRADLEGDLGGRPVVDLGTGTGVLALGAALHRPSRVVGLDRDPSALAVARRNERRLGPPVRVDWLLGDGGRAPLRAIDATVLMNPPFGAQRAAVHADRRFLAEAARIGRVSYSVHTADSRAFLDAFAADHGGTVTHAFASEIDLPRRFRFHTRDRAAVAVVIVRIAWSDRGNGSGGHG